METILCIAQSTPMIINGVKYKVIKVEDHLQNIVLEITKALDSYAHKKAIALDFSGLRKKGMATSHTGVTSGAASFAVTLDNMIQPFVAGRTDAKEFPIPVAILDKTHPDFEEFAQFTPKTIIFHDGSNLVERLKENPKDNGKVTPYWELSKKDQQEVTEQREKNAEPWLR